MSILQSELWPVLNFHLSLARKALFIMDTFLNPSPPNCSSLVRIFQRIEYMFLFHWISPNEFSLTKKYLFCIFNFIKKIKLHYIFNIWFRRINVIDRNIKSPYELQIFSQKKFLIFNHIKIIKVEILNINIWHAKVTENFKILLQTSKDISPECLLVFI